MDSAKPTDPTDPPNLKDNPGLNSPSFALPARDFRDGLIMASLLAGVWITLVSEGLSLFGFHTGVGVAALWLGFLILLWTRMRYSLPRIPRDQLRRYWVGMPGLEKVTLLLILFILLTAFVVGLMAPPQEGDVLAYHMSRIVHWDQNQRVSPYATPDARAVWMPPWPEYVGLQLYQMIGGDRLAHLLSWFALVGCTLAASRLSGFLGAGVRGQFFSAFFAATMPLVVFQASSALTDLAAAYWLLCSLWVFLRPESQWGRGGPWPWMALALGLGVLTKGTFLPYGVIIGAGFVIMQVLQAGWRKALYSGALVILVVIALWAPYLIRNQRAFGFPLGPQEQIVEYRQGQIGWRPWLSTVVRNGSLLLTTPWRGANLLIEKGTFWLHARMGWDPNHPATTAPGRQYGLGWEWPGTNSAPAHLLFLGVGAAGLLLLHRPPLSTPFTQVLLVVLLGWLLFSGTVAWQGAARLQLPMLLGLSPLGGVVYERVNSSWLRMPLVVLMFGSALPALFAIPKRPLLPISGLTRGGLLGTPRIVLTFQGDREWAEPYLRTAEEVLASGCRRIGLYIDSSDYEYLWWAVLRGDRGSLQIENQLVYPGLAGYRDPAFTPCAVLCTVCSAADQELLGMPLQGVREGIQWYGEGLGDG